MPRRASRMQLEELEAALEAAIREEAYEEAAKYRDQIRNLREREEAGTTQS